MNVVHLTHTDLRFDNRIRKEVSAIEKLDFVNATAIGTIRVESATASNLELNSQIISVKLFTDRLPNNIRALFYIFYLIELTIRFYVLCQKIRPKIIHCHDTMVLMTGVIYKLFNKTILIYDAHELESNKNGQNIILSKVTLLIEKISWRYIDVFITVSNSIVNWYADKFGDKNSLLIMNSPILTTNSNSKYDKTYLKRKFNISEDCLVYIYVGDFAYGRSIENLLRIFSELESRLHIVFVGFGELHDTILKMSNKFKNIHLHDAVPHEDVVGVLKSADIGLCLIENVSLSDYFSLPNKFFEYAFSNLYILSSNFPELNFFVAKYDLGVTTELDIESLKKNILTISSLVKNGQRDNLLELSWGNQAKKLVDCYTQLLDA